MSEENSIANKGEAEKCRDLGISYMKKGEFAKASRFFDKSLRLYPLNGVQALKEQSEKFDETNGKNDQKNSKSFNGSTSSSRGNSSSSGIDPTLPKTETSGRSFTPEQEAGSKKILLQAKSSHYEVLGISKKATADEIKKAYRKLALKYHPDKNSAPSAEAAFKAVSTAFDCLSDPSKRETYDQYGHESTEQMNQTHGHAHGGFPGAFRGQGFHEVSPEDIFNIFFQGAAGPGFRAHFGRAGGGGGFRNQRPSTADENDENRPQKSIFQQLFQFLPIILMVLMSFSSFSSNNVQPVFSLHPQGAYQLRKTTQARFGVSPGVEYYVNSQFDSLYQFSDKMYRIEKEVENEYRQHLAHLCGQQKQIRNNKMYQANFGSKEARKKAEETPTPACSEWQRRFQR